MDEVKGYTQNYITLLGYGTEDYIPSEVSGFRAIDIHHIIGRGRGGHPVSLFNCMAITREEHEEYGDKNQFLGYLKDVHFNFLIDNWTGQIEIHLEAMIMEECQMAIEFDEFRAKYSKTQRAKVVFP